MKSSLQILSFIKTYEQLHDGDLSMIGLQPKPDARGIWTEGYGHAIRKFNGKFLTLQDCSTPALAAKYGQVKTEQEAYALLRWDVENVAEGVFRRLNVVVCQQQFDALVSHAYNCGYSDTLYRLVNSGAPEEEIKNWFLTRYITAGGRELKGLVLRRKDEWEIWKHAEYERNYKLIA